VDEAGRGPLAGPVVAAAAVFRDCDALWICRDSKQLNPQVRSRLFDLVSEQLDFGIGICSAEEIDDMNIRRASLEAMRRAVLALNHTPDVLLVDGRDAVPIGIRSIAIIHGDRRVATISAASILAKVTRDRLMTDFDRQFPGYGFASHFGYPTAEHRQAICRLGVSPIHRKTFRGVREFV
jgi:ribonuclease HII